MGRKHMKYTSFHKDATFYYIVEDNKIIGYEVKGEDLRVNGAVSFDTFKALYKEVKAYDEKAGNKCAPKAPKAKKPHTHHTITPKGEGFTKEIKAINSKVRKDTYIMTASEWGYDYLSDYYKTERIFAEKNF